MAFILGFLLFLVCQNIVFAKVLNATETKKDQNATNICTDQEILNNNCSFFSEKEASFENETGSGDILSNTAQVLNFTEVSRLDNFTVEEELILLIANSSEVPKDEINRNVTDIISNNTSFRTQETYNRSGEGTTTHFNFSLPEQETNHSHTNVSTLRRNVLVLKSNCSVENSDEFTSRYLTKVGCILYINVNYISENGSEAMIAKLIQELKPLSIRSGEFDIVESYEAEKIPVNEDEIPASFLDRETLAYLAVACSFATVLLIACIIFGLRCAKKKKPVFDISTFDVKLSDYTLTRIPRASLSSTEYLHDPKLLEKTKYSIPRENCESSKCSTGEPSMNDGLQDRFPSTREFKTFKSGRVVELSGNHSDDNINFNAAYENPTFQRYF
ncbi:uncharacterized protein LOC111635467 [Centruroides sculpturatus]|uniref:uncharacterized protein LOC111635467 n=1 Tax=Centruroides sculpturatus TaxID=218467 RepID=UPI000C6D95CF|nr:uncharacterized protein LOC111635467 [Centruroides sculpturatus]XP_023236196.1 uncharacterized protein LOC111635467 [Centruroides sculpturatus]XP_023236197.1 uncharacterized protein LOC111635467 [Centruroides sculpturatus]XP_023236198.1 uncharacterized protein LOC111635467 [Centruroides sculpturatus]